jgi:hypothetical protein
MSFVFAYKSANILTLGKDVVFKDTISQIAETGATVTAETYNETQGTQLVQVSLTDVTGTAGRYRGTYAYDYAGVAVGDRLRIEIFADAGSGKELTLVLKASVKLRSA